MEEHYQKTVVEQQERLKVLQTQGEVKEDDKAEEKTKASETEEPQQEYSDELVEAAQNQLKAMAASSSGVGEAKMGGRSLRMDGGKGIEDEYNFAEDTEKLKQQMFAENDEDDVENSGSQSFLKVYKEGEAE